MLKNISLVYVRVFKKRLIFVKNEKMKNLNTLGLVSSLVGIYSTFMVWIDTPILGELKGLNNGSGMCALFIFGICSAMYIISLSSERQNLYLPILIMSLLAVCSGVYYYESIQTIIEKSASLGQISMFGTPIKSIYNTESFSIGIGCYLTIIAAGVSAFSSYLLLTNYVESED